MDYITILTKLKNGLYENTKLYPVKPQIKTGDVIDETKSVIWNREKVAEILNEYSNQVREYKKESANKSIEFSKDCTEYIKEELNCSTEKANILYTRAYEKQHSYSFMQVLYEINELVEFVKNFIN